MMIVRVVQYGPIKLPAEETDPRVDDPTRPPNFYYVQEDILRDEARDRNWDWVRLPHKFLVSVWIFFVR